MKSTLPNLVAALLASASLMGLNTPCLGAYTIGSQNVSGSRSTPQYTHESTTSGPFAWDYSYTRSFDGSKFVKHLEIDFVFDNALGWNDAQKTAYRAAAETNIETIWNNKFSVKDTANNMMFPCTVDVTTAGPFNQTVTIKLWTGDPAAAAPWNMTTWYHGDGPPVASGQAHEFGHMLGLYDEYIGGAINQYPNPLLSNDGLMGDGALNANPVMYQRYYQQYLDYMNNLNPTGSFTLVTVPEPQGITLLGLCVFVVVMRRSRRVL